MLIAKKDVEDLLKASGVQADSDSLDVMMKRLEGKSLPELIREGSGKLASMPSGGGGGAAAAAAPAGGAAEPEKKKEEAPEPEEDVDMCGMFGDEDDY